MTLSIGLEPVVRKVDNAIQRINHSLLDSAMIGFLNTHPLDRSAVQLGLGPRNRPFPSSPGPLYQNEVKCIRRFFILMQKNLIFTRKVVHLASFWKWGFLELGSGLLNPQRPAPVLFLRESRSCVTHGKCQGWPLHCLSHNCEKITVLTCASTNEKRFYGVIP